MSLAECIRELEVDVLIVGPVSAAGMDSAGTIAEVRAFLALVDEVRASSGRSLAVVLVHHENRGGKVSGAWEGAGDTLIHVTPAGRGKLGLYVQKARWSSAQHNTKLKLVWADGDGFTVDETPEPDDEQVTEQIVDAIRNDPGTGWTAIEQATPGVGDKRRRQLRDRLLGDGVIVNVGKNEHGDQVLLDHVPAKKPAHLYPGDDPTIRHLRLTPAADEPQMVLSEAAGVKGASGESAACGPALRRQGARAADAHPLASDDEHVDDELDRLADDWRAMHEEGDGW